jgi:hypothetical protein
MARFRDTKLPATTPLDVQLLALLGAMRGASDAPGAPQAAMAPLARWRAGALATLRRIPSPTFFPPAERPSLTTETSASGVDSTQVKPDAIRRTGLSNGQLNAVLAASRHRIRRPLAASWLVHTTTVHVGWQPQELRLPGIAPR